MSIELVNAYLEKQQALRLIGRRYTEADRENGSYSHKWAEWFGAALFAPLEELGPHPENGDAYVGVMHTGPEGFEYWIGMLFPAGTAAPAGYIHTDVPAQTQAVLWIRGRDETGELYGEECSRLCMDTLAEKGWSFRPEGWCFERYVCPRYTTPDAEGKVILDCCLPILEPAESYGS